MTLASGLVTVCDSISHISVSGVTVKDLDQIPSHAELQGPLLIPRPNEFITDLTSTRTTFGISGASKVDLVYVLNYVYLHSPIGSGISELEAYAGLITNIVAILNAIINNDTITGAVDINLDGVDSIGTVEDPAANRYWGCFLRFRVTEFVQ